MPIGSNTFTGGLNTDSDINTQPNDTYRDAINIDTVDNGAFSALNNMKGTTDVGTLQTFTGTDDVNILGQFEAFGLFSGVEKACVLYFVKVGSLSRIYALNTQDNIVAIIFDENDGELSFPDSGSVDAYYNKEKGINTVYFVDFVNEFRKIVIDDSIVNTLEGLTLRPVSGVDILTFSDLQDGGQLDAGTYQFAYRYVKVGTVTVSAWSGFTNPIPAIPKELADVTDADKVVGGTVGSPTGKAIKLSLALTVANSGRFDAVELAIVRNTTGSLTAEITAIVLSPSKDYYDTPSNILYTGSENGTTIPIEEIVVEDNPIDTAKTIDQKDNRLFLGNIKVNDLTVSDSQGTFTNAKTISNESDDSYKEPGDTVNIRGYFREELYRYGVVYEDKFGNTSSPKPLDFNFRRRHLQDTSFTAASIISVIFNSPTTSTITLTGDFTATLKQHDKITRSSATTITGAVDDENERFKLTTNSTLAGAVTTVTVAGDFNSISGSNVIRLIGDEGNCIGDNSTSIDWQFPERNVNKYSLLNNSDQATRLGIRIEGITNHPLYAKKMRIVRLPREKNILFQTPHVPTVAYQGVPSPGKNPDDNNDHNGPFIQLGNCGRETDALASDNIQARAGSPASEGNVSTFTPKGDNTLDFIGPKLFRLGAAKNLVRFARRGWVDGGDSDGIYSSTTVATPAWSTAMKQADTITFDGNIFYADIGTPTKSLTLANQVPDGFDTQRDICPIMLAVPPEYVFNDAGDPFSEYSFSSAQQAHIVDAVGFATKIKVSENQGESQNGFISSTHTTRATVYQAIDHKYYFYNRDGKGILDGSDQFFFTRITDTKPFLIGAAKEFTRLKNAITQVLNGSPITLTDIPFIGNALFDYIIKWGNGLELSADQGNQTPVINAVEPVSDLFGNPVENQRGIIMILDSALEDFSVRVGSEFTDGKKLFPLITTGTSDQQMRNLYDEIYLTAGLAYLNDKGIASNNDHPMANSVQTARSTGEVGAENGFAGTTYIINIERGLGDDRYGSVDASQNYISTGFEIEITSPTQIVNADIFGGDCFVTKQVFKINNSAARPIRFEGPAATPPQDYDLNAGGTNVGTTIGEYKTGSNDDDVEILELYIESEVNGAYSAETGVYPETKTSSIEQYNADFLYPYLFNYSQENNVKTYVSKNRSIPVTDNFPARIAFSDQKVLNSNIEGFDRFRTLSIKDLEEQYGGITKLIKTSDSELWAIQDKAVRWIPVGKEEITLDSGQSLGTVGANVVIGRTVLYLSTTSGSQHIRTVKSKGDLVFYVDAEKREVNAFASKGKIDTISNSGMYTFFKDLLTRSQEIPENVLMGGYDFNKKEYWVVYNSWTDKVPNASSVLIDTPRGGKNAVFNDKIGKWKTLVNTGSNELKGLVFANQELYGASVVPSSEASKVDLKSWTFYTNNNRGEIFGSYVDSGFTIIANSQPGNDKIFDVMIFDAKDRVDSVDVSIEDEITYTPTQIASNINAFKKGRDGKFYVNDIRNDTDKSRLRGQSAIQKITIINDLANNREVRVTAILNKFRISARNL